LISSYINGAGTLSPKVSQLHVGLDPAATPRRSARICPDEKIKGTVHLALGRSYPETGGRNVSALHWDLICDLRPGGRLLADGETIMEDGVFRWPFDPK
jgi:leucyl aminopeptidase (aminopeptidase T)